MAARYLGFLCALAVIEGLLASAALCGDVTVKKVDAPFPRDGLRIRGSGSGIVLLPRLVLTNRHVAGNDAGEPASRLLNVHGVLHLGLAAREQGGRLSPGCFLENS